MSGYSPLYIGTDIGKAADRTGNDGKGTLYRVQGIYCSTFKMFNRRAAWVGLLAELPTLGFSSGLETEPSGGLHAQHEICLKDSPPSPSAPRAPPPQINKPLKKCLITLEV